MSDSWDYAKAGLNLDAYAKTMAGIQPLLASTWRGGVIPPPFPARPGGKGSGGFASLFDLNKYTTTPYANPVLVNCTDGVGSKLKIAAMMRKYDTVGIDLVAMSVNDLICTGAEPLVFLDYIAMPDDDTSLTLELVTGIARGCRECGCALVGGETAILPEFYAPGDFDMAGFATGVVERDRVIDGSKIAPGDVLIALASSGLHSNGYSLARKVVFDAGKLDIGDHVPELGVSVGEALLRPTTLYAKPIRALLAQCPGGVTGLANITGGGVTDNLARILPPTSDARIDRSSWAMPPIFTWIQQLGNVAVTEMDRVFNCGVGFVVVVKANAADTALSLLRETGETAWVLGGITAGTAKVFLN